MLDANRGRYMQIDRRRVRLGDQFIRDEQDHAIGSRLNAQWLCKRWRQPQRDLGRSVDVLGCHPACVSSICAGGWPPKARIDDHVIEHNITILPPRPSSQPERPRQYGTLPIGNSGCHRLIAICTTPRASPMSTATAEQVIADTVQAAQAVLGSEIEAMFVLGSLAHGGFAPLVSDVDVAIVVGAMALGTAEQMARVQSLVVEKASSPLSERLSVFWADWHTVRTGEGVHSRLGPVDRLDLLDSGRLLLGSDLREPSVRPSHQELVVMSADHIVNKFTDAYLDGLRDTRTLLAGGPRASD
jgi:predicted nucleotidyltransferase